MSITTAEVGKIMRKRSDTQKIEITFYKGAYGPTVQIHLPSDELLAAMKDIFYTLASGGATEIKLHDLPFAELSGLDEFYLRGTSSKRSKTVQVSRKEENKTVVNWFNSPGGWDNCAGLLDGFGGSLPGHHYLSEEGIDDALIVVDYFEPRSE